MIEKNKGKKFTENAFLVGAVHSGLTPTKVNEHLHELELLAQTAGANVVHHFVYNAIYNIRHNMVYHITHIYIYIYILF